MIDPVVEAERLGRSVEIVRQFCPKFEVRDKENSWTQRLIGRLLGRWMPSYMTDFWTTIGFTTYRPSLARADGDQWMTVFHEGLHAVQAKRLTRPIFYLLYLFPVSLAPFLLALLPFPMNLILGGIMLLPKLPDPFRFRFETRAYQVNLAIDFWMYGDEVLRADNLAWYADQMLGPNYYFTWPFKESTYRTIKRMAQEVQTGAVFEGRDGEYFMSVYRFMIDEGLVSV